MVYCALYINITSQRMDIEVWVVTGKAIIDKVAHRYTVFVWSLQYLSLSSGTLVSWPLVNHSHSNDFTSTV